MNNPNLQGKRSVRTKEQYYTILKYQLLIILGLSGSALFFDIVSAYSLLLGGLIYWIPQAYLVKRHFDVQVTQSAHRTLAQLYASQIWKMALMAILFSLVFVLVDPISVFSLFAMLILLQVSHLIMQFGVKQAF